MKYSENEILQEIHDYIEGTYGQHYVGKNSFQIQDLLHSIDIAVPFCQANAIKYLSRYGKKRGANRLDLLKAVHYTILLMHFCEDDDGSEDVKMPDSCQVEEDLSFSGLRGPRIREAFPPFENEQVTGTYTSPKRCPEADVEPDVTVKDNSFVDLVSEAECAVSEDDYEDTGTFPGCDCTGIPCDCRQKHFQAELAGFAVSENDIKTNEVNKLSAAHDLATAEAKALADPSRFPEVTRKFWGDIAYILNKENAPDITPMDKLAELQAFLDKTLRREKGKKS